MAHAQMNDQEARTQRVFRALMWALAYPGCIQPLAGEGLQTFLAIGQTLIDLETSYYTNHAELNAHLARLGARFKPPEVACYQFYPQFDAKSLQILRNAPTGTYLSPDESATLILGAELGVTGSGVGYLLHLSGPGIPKQVELAINGIPVEFWKLRQAKNIYPMGWDIFLVGSEGIVGLPRTTQVEVKNEWRT